MSRRCPACCTPGIAAAACTACPCAGIAAQRLVHALTLETDCTAPLHCARRRRYCSGGVLQRGLGPGAGRPGGRHGRTDQRAATGRGQPRPHHRPMPHRRDARSGALPGRQPQRDDQRQRGALSDRDDPPFGWSSRPHRKTTVRCPLSRMRCSTWRRTARASTSDSVSLPRRTSSRGVIAWSTRATSCSMIGPSSRSLVT